MPHFAALTNERGIAKVSLVGSGSRRILRRRTTKQRGKDLPMKKIRKLSLKREVVRVLTGEEQRRIAGGISGTRECHSKDYGDCTDGCTTLTTVGCTEACGTTDCTMPEGGC